MPEWPIGTDCKSVGLSPAEVRILPLGHSFYLMEHTGTYVSSTELLGWGIVSGKFKDVLSYSRQPGKLEGSVAFVYDYLRNTLSRKKEVRVLDLGGMFSYSFYCLAVAFRDEIEKAHIEFLSTNKEPFFFTSTLEWRDPFSFGLTQEEARFILDNTGLVRHLNGIDTFQLPDILGDEKCTFIHESWGGIRHHQVPLWAARAVTRSMEPGGVLMTDTPLPEDFMANRVQYHYQQWNPSEISPYTLWVPNQV